MVTHTQFLSVPGFYGNLKGREAFNPERPNCFVIAEWCRLCSNTNDGNGSRCSRHRWEWSIWLSMAVALRLNVNADQRRLRCLTDSQAAPQTRAVWLWFELGQRGRSLLAVLWQNKEINIWKGYWYMSRQGPIRYHYYQILYIDIRHGTILLHIFQSAFVFLSLFF